MHSVYMDQPPKNPGKLEQRKNPLSQKEVDEIVKASRKANAAVPQTRFFIITNTTATLAKLYSEGFDLSDIKNPNGEFHKKLLASSETEEMIRQAKFFHQQNKVDIKLEDVDYTSFLYGIIKESYEKKLELAHRHFTSAGLTNKSLDQANMSEMRIIATVFITVARFIFKQAEYLKASRKKYLDLHFSAKKQSNMPDPSMSTLEKLLTKLYGPMMRGKIGNTMIVERLKWNKQLLALVNHVLNEHCKEDLKKYPLSQEELLDLIQLAHQG